MFVNSTDIHKFKAKDSGILPNNLCLENVSKNFSANNSKKSGFNCHIYNFSVAYDPIAVDDILDIHKYLIRTNDIIECSSS